MDGTPPPEHEQPTATPPPPPAPRRATHAAWRIDPAHRVPHHARVGLLLLAVWLLTKLPETTRAATRSSAAALDKTITRLTRVLAPVADRLAPVRKRLDAGTARINERYFDGHGGIVTGTLAVLAGLALIGTAAVGLSGSPTPTDNTQAAAVAAALTDRSAQPERAERANRSTPPPTTPASVAPAAPTATAPAPATPAPTAPVTPAPKPEWVAPTSNYFISSCFGYRTDPYPQSHPGLDFAAPPGTPVVAARAGTVIIAGWSDDGYGNKVVIQHGPQTFTLYGHGQQVLAHVGQHVEPGDPIMLEGSTGDSTGPHLHFEVWTAMWQRIDPAPFLRAMGVPINDC